MKFDINLEYFDMQKTIQRAFDNLSYFGQEKKIQQTILINDDDLPFF